jgi:hypothetical protein
LDVKVFAEDRTPINSTFENNIFYFEGKGEWGANAEGINTVFRNNLYFNIEPHSSETQAITDDPEFLKPGSAGTDIDLKTMAQLSGYQLKPGSKGINSGLEIDGRCEVDVQGNPIGMTPADLGALESKNLQQASR